MYELKRCVWKDEEIFLEPSGIYTDRLCYAFRQDEGVFCPEGNYYTNLLFGAPAFTQDGVTVTWKEVSRFVDLGRMDGVYWDTHSKTLSNEFLKTSGARVTPSNTVLKYNKGDFVLLRREEQTNKNSEVGENRNNSFQTLQNLKEYEHVTRNWLLEHTDYVPLEIVHGEARFMYEPFICPEKVYGKDVVPLFGGDVFIDLKRRVVYLRQSSENSHIDEKISDSAFTLRDILMLFSGQSLHKQWWGFGDITPDNTSITKKDGKIQIRMKTPDNQEQDQVPEKVLCLKVDSNNCVVQSSQLPKEGLVEITEGYLWFHEKTKTFYGVDAAMFDYAICDKELADARDVLRVLHGLESVDLAWLLNGPEPNLVTMNASRKQNQVFMAPVNSRTTKVSLHQRTFKLEYIDVQNTEDNEVDIEKLIESPLDFFKFVASEGESVIPKQIFDMLERVEKGFKADQIATICSGKGKSLLKKYDFMQQLKSGAIKAVLKYNGFKLVEAKVVDIATTPIDKIHEITSICSADEYVKGHLYYIK